MRCRGRRLAQTTVRAMLVLGGVIVSWGAYEAITHEPAQAAESPRPGILDTLLDDTGAVVDGVLSAPPASPARSTTIDPSPDETGAVREPAPAPPEAAAAWIPRRAERDPAVRTPPADLATRVPRAVDRRAGTGWAGVVEAIGPVTRPTVDAAAQRISKTKLRKPVNAALRPVAEPIVEKLPPVRGLTRPILGDPANPVVPPAGSVEPPGPAPAVAVTITPGPVAQFLGACATQTHPQAVSPLARHTVPGSGAKPAGGVAADPDRGPTGVPGSPSGGHTPAPSGNAISSVSSGAGTAMAAETWPHSWTPDLVSQRCPSFRCGAFTGRSPQPDTRPA